MRVRWTDPDFIFAEVRRKEDRIAADRTRVMSHPPGHDGAAPSNPRRGWLFSLLGLIPAAIAMPARAAHRRVGNASLAESDKAPHPTPTSS